MRIDGLSDTGIRINKDKRRSIDREKRKKEIQEQNIRSSEVDIRDFDTARDITAKITGRLDEKGTSIIDPGKIDGSRIFDLLKDDD
ncbi:MAG: hypothetical protein ACOCWO_06075 [Candidatus Muiribacteriaceae bacterium]